MSIASVRTALESKLNAMTPAVAIAWNNLGYTPVTGTPYQACYLLPAKPDNPTLGDGFYRMQGIFQISLFYPTGVGPQTADKRADLTAAAFKRGTTMTSGGIKVLVDEAPYIGQGRADGDRWMIPIRVRYSAGVVA